MSGLSGIPLCRLSISLHHVYRERHEAAEGSEHGDYACAIGAPLRDRGLGRHETRAEAEAQGGGIGIAVQEPVCVS